MTTVLRTGGREARPRDWYLAAGREYYARYGELTQACLNPAAAKRCGRPDLVERYYAGREDGTAWPSLNSVKKSFGSFNTFRAELGLPPNSTGPPDGRRKAGEAEPILNVRERRVVVASEGTVWLRRQLEKAERRALRAEEKLEAAKTAADRAAVEDQLRNRLADEKARRREVQRELHNAERREVRAREREVALRAATREESSLLREVDRLSTRLAAAEGRAPAKTPPRTKTIVKTKTRTRTVTVQDAALLKRVERAEERLTEARAALVRSQAHAGDLAETLAGVRRDALAAAMATERVRSAERQVAEAEKKMAEMAELLVAERRILTDEEMESLRTNGPAGHRVFGAMVKRVARAHLEGGRDDKRAALTDAIAAALNWRDRL